MMAMSGWFQSERERIDEFMRGLTELTKRTGIAINGCGCDGSPYLDDVIEEDFKGYFSEDNDGGCIQPMFETVGWSPERYRAPNLSVRIVKAGGMVHWLAEEEKPVD